MDTEISVNALTRHRSVLEEYIDPDSGLLDELLRSRILTPAEVRSVKYEGPYHKRTAKLLEYIIENNKFDSFVDSLRNARQAHIVNYLFADGEYRPEFNFDWPLTAEQLAILNDNQGFLVDLIELSDLLSRLFEKDVINKRQRDIIASKHTSHEKNEAFLDILRQRSQKDYRLTIDCLNESNQSHISKVLAIGGVAVPIHATTDETAEGEREIVEEMTMRLADKSLEECDRIWEQTRLKIIAVKLGQSIVLYVYCQTLKDLQQLHTWLKSGSLKHATERLLSMISHRSRKTKVLNVTVEDKLFTRTKQFLEEGASSQKYVRGARETKYERRLKEQDHEVMETKHEFANVTKELQDQKIVLGQQEKIIENLRLETEQKDLAMKEMGNRFNKLETENKSLRKKCKELNVNLEELELDFHSAEGPPSKDSDGRDQQIENKNKNRELYMYMNQKLIEMEEKLGKVTKESEDQLIAIKKKDDFIANLHKEHRLKDSKIKEREKIFAKLEAENQDLIETRKEVEKYESLLKKRDHEVSILQLKIEEKDLKMKETAERYDRQEKENKDLTEKLKELEAKLKDL